MFRSWIGLAALMALFTGCVSAEKNTPQQVVDVPRFEVERFPTNEAAESTRSFSRYFESENYLGRINKIKSLATHLRKLMDQQGHPRQFILEKFLVDVNTEHEYLKIVERDVTNLTPAWLPVAGSYEYSAKLISLERVIQSAKVMNQIDNFVVNSKILEADNYEHNFYLGLLRKAISELENQYLQVRQLSTARNRAAVFGYSRMIADTARIHVHKFFKTEEKANQRKVENYLARLPFVTSPEQAKQMVTGSDYILAKSYLAYSEGSAESDIDGFEAVKQAKLATLMGLETIRYLYTNLN